MCVHTMWGGNFRTHNIFLTRLFFINLSSNIKYSRRFVEKFSSQSCSQRPITSFPPRVYSFGIPRVRNENFITFRRITSLKRFENYFNSLQQSVITSYPLSLIFSSFLPSLSISRKHQELSNQLMNSNLTPAEMTRIAKEYNLSEKKIHLLHSRSQLITSITELTEMIEEERKK